MNPITWRATPQELEQIDAAAKLAGTTRSRLMREAAMIMANDIRTTLNYD